VEVPPGDLAGEPADAARRGLGGVTGPRERGLPARDLPSRGLPVRDGLSPRLLDDLGEDALAGFLFGVVGIDLQAPPPKNLDETTSCFEFPLTFTFTFSSKRRTTKPPVNATGPVEKLPIEAPFSHFTCIRIVWIQFLFGAFCFCPKCTALDLT
jgi:hypothetical protein